MVPSRIPNMLPNMLPNIMHNEFEQFTTIKRNSTKSNIDDFTNIATHPPEPMNTE